MITEHDLQEAILECQGQRNPTSSTCLKLAALYTIRDKMYPEEQSAAITPDVKIPLQTYSYANAANSDSEFMQAVADIDDERLMSIMDELMTTLKAVVPRLYDGVMRRLKTK